MKRLLIPLLLFSSFSRSASFDCGLVQTEVERMICANQSLSKMDEVISTLYLKAAKSDAGDVIKQEHIQWLGKRIAACQTPYYCKKFYGKRIDDLVGNVHFVQNFLTEGMTLPDQGSLDDISSDALDNRLAVEHYKPWPRRALISSYGYGLYDAEVVVSGDEIFIYYLSGKWDARILYQYSPLSGITFRVTNAANYFEGNKTHYSLINNDSLEKGYYDLWTRSESGKLYPLKYDPQELAASEFGQSSGDYALSNDGTKFAMATKSLYERYSQQSENATHYRTRLRQEPEVDKLAKMNTIAIYDSATDNVEIMSNDALGEDQGSEDWWSIYNVIWAQDDRSVYFDNKGGRACIWEYRVDDKALYKIVPEHTAEEPYPFTYQGHDYILYYENYDHRRLMIAVRPD